MAGSLQPAEKFGDSIRRNFLAHAFLEPFEKDGNRDTKELSDLHKARRTDPVQPFFIFLYLLKCDADPFRQITLAEALSLPFAAQSLADQSVDDSGTFRIGMILVSGCHTQA